MRAALLTTVLAAGVLMTGVPAAAGTVRPARVGPGRVGPARIARAVRSAERSPSLWATVNICSSRKYPHDLGVRGQMPTLGFPASLYMVIQVDYWSAQSRSFLPIQSKLATTRLSLGNASGGLEQGGAVFPFRPHTGLLNAKVTFTWTRSGKVIGQTVRRTTAGHSDADHSSPPNYSAAQCRIK